VRWNFRSHVSLCLSFPITSRSAQALFFNTTRKAIFDEKESCNPESVRY
jgi:hypothetical protein